MNKKLSVILIGILLMITSGPVSIAVSNNNIKTENNNDYIIDIISNINEELVRNYIQTLQDFGSKVTGTEACIQAENYIFEEFQDMGLNTQFLPWTNGEYEDRNIEAILPGESDKCFIICAHLDTVEGSPGADDDCSGVAAVLAAAKTINENKGEKIFAHTIRFVLFTGTEQMFKGSFIYALEAEEQGLDIIGIIEAHLLGYIGDMDDGNIQMNIIRSKYMSDWIADVGENTAGIYEELIGITTINRQTAIGYFGDRYPFETYKLSFAFFSAFYFNNDVHTPEDTIDKLDLDYAARLTRLIVATLLKIVNNEFENQPPDKPAIPSGPSSGKPEIEYDFSISTTDAEDNMVYYKWDWDDGNESDWLGPYFTYSNSQICGISHIWIERGDYNVRVKAKDNHNAESEWSDPLTIALLKQKMSTVNYDNWFYYPKLQNYAPKGIPDFDQRQESWRNSLGMQSFCGPTSVANVLWYIDSKYSDPLGYPGDGIDNYLLVQDYNAPSNPEPGPLSDDHNFNNVNDPTTPWDSVNNTYGNEFIEKIAWYVDNDGVRTGENHLGSTSNGICEGITQWIQDVEISNSFDIIKHDTTHKKSLNHIINHIECGDFIILNLGFYTTTGFFRGSHWVTVAGISKSLNKIVISDPYNDFTNITTDYTAHNDADIVSHDIFNINNTSPLSTKSSWWIEDYKPDYAQNSNALIKDAIVIAPIIDNKPPEKPTIDGPESGKIEIEYQYIGLSNDINNDTLYYLWDWGDGNKSDWLGPYDSGENSNTSHIWFDKGNYEIRVKTKDIHGEESDWSEALIVSVPKNREINKQLIEVIKKYSIINHLYQKFLNF